MATSPEAALPPRRLRRRPVGHRLMTPIYLPITQLLINTRYKLHEIGLGAGPSLNAYSRRVLEAALHHYFVDAEAKQWQQVWDELEPLVVGRFDDDFQLSLLQAFHGMIHNTTGPLMPSFHYRYEIEGDALVLIPSLPTIEEYEERIRALADPEDGWVPTRYRR